MPSVEDLLSLKKSGASLGIIACHDGGIYSYRLVKEPEPGYNLSREDLYRTISQWIRKSEQELFSAIEDRFGIKIEHYQ